MAKHCLQGTETTGDGLSASDALCRGLASRWQRKLVAHHLPMRAEAGLVTDDTPTEHVSLEPLAELVRAFTQSAVGAAQR